MIFKRLKNGDIHIVGVHDKEISDIFRQYAIMIVNDELDVTQANTYANFLLEGLEHY
ncbi:hypothetical protein ACMAZD_09925 [Vibrio sp. nBUS_14]|uniref:hypothetical protein n=1 Tax=Vibrio sp. nBUS_14 TaxID=3395321 RepID=UPI003EBC14B6